MPPRGAPLGVSIRLRQIEVLVGERIENVVGERRRAGIGRPFRRRVARLGDIQAGRVFVQVLDVADLAAAIDGDRRRQAGVEELALVVADDDDRVGRHVVEFACRAFPARCGTA